MNNYAERKGYVVGLDFGTLSARAVIVQIADGKILADTECIYPHGVMDRTLSAADNQPLPPDYALQVPDDYLYALRICVTEVLSKSGIDPTAVKGVAIDATSSSVVVSDKQGKALCNYPQFKNNPHAYLKLWKHHGGQSQVERIVALAKQRKEPWLMRYGGILSSEMLLPKALETLEKSPEVYQAAAEICDVLDWLTWHLTGQLSYAVGDSGYKRTYQDDKYPSKEFLAEINPDFAQVYEEKMSHPIVPLASKVGGLIPTWAKILGLSEGTAVAAGNIDAHVHAVSVNAVKPGQMTGIMGTSTCWILPSDKPYQVPGVFGLVYGGVCAGIWAFEAGQSAVGDIFAWFIENCVPKSYYDEAKDRGVSIYQLLETKAAKQQVGEHGLVALDWWNGNRSILVDAKLSGLLIGQTLATSPEDIYRALLESTAFGARIIFENYEKHGVAVKEIYIAGGLLKNKFLMQMYADITNRPLSIATTLQAGAHGSAITAAVACGAYPDLPTAAAHMGGVIENAYLPNETAVKDYDRLFECYKHLYELFGREDDTMYQLRQLRQEVLARKMGK